MTLWGYNSTYRYLQRQNRTCTRLLWWHCTRAVWNRLERSLRGLSHVFYHTAVPVLTGAIKSWLSCQLKGSEVKLILSETGCQWAAWRGGVGGLWPVDCYDGLGRRVEGEHKKTVVTRGESGWLDNSVATWFSFLKPGWESGRLRGKECRNVPDGGCSSKSFLSKWLSVICKYISAS